MRHGAAVIGLGNISDSHITGWKRLENVDLKVLVEIDRARSETKAKEYGIASYETDFQKILRRDDIDIVDICLPHHLHAAFSCQALEAGKHVLVEKPIAITLPEAHAMTEAAKKNEKKLMVAENVRFMPIHDHGKALLEQGDIGKSFMLTTRAELYAAVAKFQGPHTGWRTDPAKIGGGVMLTTGIHSVSLARSLVGEIVSVFAIEGEQTRKEIPVDNTMHVLFNFESGATGQGSFSWATKWFNDKNDTTIFGTEGIIGLNISRDTLWLEKGNERTTWIEHSDGPYQGQWKLIKHFVDCIDQDKTPASDGVEETKSLRVVLAAYQSARQGRIIRVDEVR